VEHSLFTFSPFTNPWLLGGIAISIAIRFVPTLIPEAASLFRTAEFPPEWWPLVLLSFLPSLAVVEIDKAISALLARRTPANRPS
jgi:hypothetical protein